MKNMINNKVLKLFKFSMVVLLIGLVLTSCEDNYLKIRQDFPFEVQVMPVPGKIAENETVEIRISLITSSDFSGTTYSLRYFQYEGSGQLQHYSDPPYLQNDEYPLKQKEFRLYYTSKAQQSQKFTIWIKDSFGNERKVDFEFDNA
ncbi:TraQ conjugal transfer family protein [Chryseobacterium sp. KACC 21268]|nr:TraQ conjugal transfer family protein [Chryseobacterium sp. KACC 21268]